jgi:hypothetical protein
MTEEKPETITKQQLVAIVQELVTDAARRLFRDEGLDVEALFLTLAIGGQTMTIGGCVWTDESVDSEPPKMTKGMSDALEECFSEAMARQGTGTVTANVATGEIHDKARPRN